ncbi:MAG: DUF2284 domain-containing protein [Desulfobacterales bacterium]|nr:DUF2284 domain-containing protein [Desulfobacterales bacterium]
MDTQNPTLTNLINLALELGATHAAPLASAAIRTRAELAQSCTTCPNHGSSQGCPPHPGPPEFERWKGEYPTALAVKMEVPMEILLSHQGREIYSHLHILMAQLEIRALENGIPRARAFASGGCKDLFCGDHPNCAALNSGHCRHPEKTRPSMSGYGVDVAHLLHLAGWQDETQGLPDDKAPMGFACGLLLMAL